MSVTFCQTCGHRMEYKGLPPNFCGKCGESLRRLKVEKQEEDTETSESLSWDKSKLKLSVTISGASKGLTIEEIKALGPDLGEEIGGRQGLAQKPQDLLKMVQAECSSSKGKFQDVE